MISAFEAELYPVSRRKLHAARLDEWSLSDLHPQDVMTTAPPKRGSAPYECLGCGLPASLSI